MKRLGTATAIGLAVLLAAGLVTTAASAGGDGSGATAAAGKKKKTCPAGTTKKVLKKKNGKKKVICAPNPVTPTPVTPAPLGATLSISPTSFDFGPHNQQELDDCNAPPDPDCPTQVFTVSNAGPGPSGTPVPTTSMISTVGGYLAFEVFANTCTAPLAPGGSCTVTVRAAADDNFEYVGQVNVSASPGGTASATLGIE